MRRLRVECLGLASALVLLGAPAAGQEEEHAHEHEHEEHEEIEEIVVTHSPLEHERGELAVPVDRLSRDDIVVELGTTLGETLQNRPGITTSSFAGGASRPIIRGQDAFRTEVLEDGLRTQDVSRESPDHGVPVNPLTAERIEVLRGPAALRYGGGAVAGVVNTITNRVPHRRRDRLVTGEVLGAIDTVAEARDVAFLLDGGRGPFAWHVDGLLRETQDYEIPGNGEGDLQKGTFTDPKALSAGASYLHERGRLGFAYARFENEYGIPEDEDVFIDMQTDRFRFEGDLEAPFAFAREIRVRGVYSDYTHDEIAEGMVGQTFDNDEFEGRLELLHEPVLGFVGAFGIQGRQREFEAGGEAAEFLAPADTRTVAGYLFEERALADGLVAELGLRLESTRVEGTPETGGKRDRDFFPVSGAASLLYQPFDDWRLGLRGAVTQRAPSQVELFAQGPHEATGTDETGDPDLDEETGYTGELRAEGSLGPVRIDWAGFATWYDDYIFAALTGETVGPEADEQFDQLFYLARDAVFYGTELAVEADLVQALAGTFGMDGQFDFVRARFRTDSAADKDLPRITPIRWGGGLFYRNPWMRARVGFRRTEEQSDVGAFETKTSDFTFLNASLVFRISLLEDRVPVELSVVGRNLTNERGRNHVAFNKDEVLLPGRNVRVGIRARF